MKNLKKLLSIFLLGLAVLLTTGCTTILEEYMGFDLDLGKNKRRIAELTPVLDTNDSQGIKEAWIIMKDEDLVDYYNGIANSTYDIDFALSLLILGEYDFVFTEFTDSLYGNILTDTMNEALNLDIPVIEEYFEFLKRNDLSFRNSNVILEDMLSRLTIVFDNDKERFDRINNVALFEQHLMGNNNTIAWAFAQYFLEVNHVVSREQNYELMQSEAPGLREFACIGLGELKDMHAIEKLKIVATYDEAFYKQEDDLYIYTIYYVREAAEKAIQKILLAN